MAIDGAVRVLRTEAEITAYLHRTRMMILDVLLAGPATSSQIAARLQVHPANLTRHLRMLREAGLIRIAETRDTGKNLEKYYVRLGERFVVEPDAGGLTAPHQIALTFAQSQLAEARARLPERVDLPFAALCLRTRLTPERARQLQAEFEDLARRYAAEDGEPAGCLPYELVLTLLPGQEDPPGVRDAGTVRLEPRGGAS